MSDAVSNFIYIGSPKAGSSWLFQALSAHPDVYVSPEKSTTFYETADAGDVADYLSHFEDAASAHAVGEIAHDTFLEPTAAARIFSDFPDMKILCCLREPADYAKSSVLWWASHTTRYGETLEEMLGHERLLRIIDYPSRLAPFYDLFPADQIKVVFFDDLKRDPEAFLREIYSFLDVDSGVRPSVLDEVVNPARRARFRVLTHLAYASGGVLRGFGFGRYVEAVKQWPIVDRLLYSKLRNDVSPELKTMLLDVKASAQSRHAVLEKMIGHSVPSTWLSS